MAKILIGYSCCPLTRAAFEAQGHDVWTCDLLPARDDSTKHFQCDVWDVLGYDWDMAVLHPMCTYLTCSAAWAFNDPDFDKYPEVGYHQKVKPGTLVGLERRQARDEALDNFRKLLELPYPVAIENPGTSFLNKAIRRPDQIVDPFDFGDDARKATGFWLKGLPKLKIDRAERCDGRMVEWPKGSGKLVERWANQTDAGQNNVPPSDARWLARSETYPGIAAAMGAQWGALFEASPVEANLVEESYALAA